MIKAKLHMLLLFVSISVFSQQKTVRGNVVIQGTNDPLVGVSVKVLGTTIGAVTDFDGNFELNNVSSDQEIEFSSIGFFTQKIKIGDQLFIRVQLKEDIQTLDDVVVVGYGTQKKKEITGAVAVIEEEVIEKLNPVRVEQALQGQVSGVNISSASGSPGSGLNIRIRGVSTNGDNRPLILVDGNQITDLSAINPNDIKSVNVLKDAAAGIYGVRAANGVIIIETKSGKKASPLKFNVDSYIAFQQTSKKIDLLNPTQFAQNFNTVTGSDRFFIQESTGNIFDTEVSAVDPVSTTDWQDEVFEIAPMYNFNIGANGGTEKLAYSLGGSYLSQDGIVGGDKANFNRATARAKLTYDFSNRFKLSTNTIYTFSEKQNLLEGVIGSVLFNAINADPLSAVFDNDPNADPNANGFGFLKINAVEIINPLAQVANAFDTTTRRRLSQTLTGEYKIFDNLNIRTKYAYNREVVDYFIFRPIAFFGLAKSQNTVLNSLVDNRDIFTDFTWNNVLTFKDTFHDKHNLEVLLGQEIWSWKGDFSGYNANTLRNGANDVSLAQLGNFEVVQPRFNEASLALGNDQGVDRLFSLFSRLQYNYDEKYLFSGMLRRDVSPTRFSEDNRVGYFPSFSLGWLISEENFLKDVDFVSSLKLRASYGEIGNDRIDQFGFISRLNGLAVISNNDEQTNEDLLFGVAEGTISNPDLTWETSITQNLGVDLYLLNNRINVTADVYKKDTRDLLVTPDASSILGGDALRSSHPTINAGNVVNSGFEFLISYRDQFSKDFSFNTSFNITTVNNEVTFVASQTDLIEEQSFGIGNDTAIIRMQVGEELGFFHGYKTDGVYQDQAQIDALNVSSPTGTYHSGAEVGDLIFVDTNGDGQITSEDRVNLGSPIPEFTGGFNIGFEYKNIDFSASAVGSYGNELIRDYERVNVLANQGARVVDAFTVENPSNTVPRAGTDTLSQSNLTDYNVEDASYLRVQNVQLGYTLPKKLMDKIGVDKLRFYASANNLHTFTNYSGFDPSANGGGPLSGGIDRGFYPVAETYIFGMNLNF